MESQPAVARLRNSPIRKAPPEGGLSRSECRLPARTAKRWGGDDRRHTLAAVVAAGKSADLLSVARGRLRRQLRAIGLVSGHGEPRTSPRTAGPRIARAARRRMAQESPNMSHRFHPQHGRELVDPLAEPN